MLTSEEYELLLPDVQTAARTTARSWDGVIEFDDAEQEIWERLLGAGRSTIDKVLEMDKPLRVSSLTRIGQQVGSQYRDDFEVFSGNWVYSTKKVRDMLGLGALKPAKGNPKSDVPSWDLPRSLIEKLDETETETRSERRDLFLGMKALAGSNEVYASAIKNSYWTDGNPKLTSSERKRLQRAVDALTREMNRSHTRVTAQYDNGIGARKVLSNAQADTATTFDYAGRSEER